MLFSKKKGTQDKESLYMKELYSLLRLSWSVASMLIKPGPICADVYD
jgi:hypothetical protein